MVNYKCFSTLLEPSECFVQLASFTCHTHWYKHIISIHALHQAFTHTFKLWWMHWGATWCSVSCLKILWHEDWNSSQELNHHHQLFLSFLGSPLFMQYTVCSRMISFTHYLTDPEECYFFLPPPQKKKGKQKTADSWKDSPAFVCTRYEVMNIQNKCGVETIWLSFHGNNGKMNDWSLL